MLADDGSGAFLELSQFHLHKPSEHSVNGSRFAMELHLVHTDAAGRIAEVQSILFPLADAHNAFLDSFLWDTNAARAVGAVALAPLLADTGPVEYAYAGSLTSPPCSEGVRWRVRTSRTGVNALQLLAFEYAIGGETNARPLQARAGRAVGARAWRAAP